jgi:hypothetical protein
MNMFRQFHLKTLFLTLVALCPLFSLLARHPNIGSGFTEMTVGVGSSILLASFAPRNDIRWIVLAIRVVGFAANATMAFLALLVGLVGLAGGTDTSEHANTSLAIGGLVLGCAALVNCIALALPNRWFSGRLFAGAVITSTLFFLMHLWPLVMHFEDRGSTEGFYAIAYVSANALVMRFISRQ